MISPSIKTYQIPIIISEPLAVEFRHFHAVVCSFVENENHNKGKSEIKDYKSWSSYGAELLQNDNNLKFQIVISSIVSENNLAEAEDIYQKLTNLKRGLTLHFGRQIFKIAEPAKIVADTPISEIYNSPPVSRISYRTLTPAIGAKGSVHEPLIRLDKTLQGLANKWNSFFGKEYPITIDKAKIERSTSLQYIKGDTKELKIKKNNELIPISQPGFLGEFKYRFSENKDTEELRSISKEVSRLTNCLLKYGEFMGIGSKTAWGFGQIKITETAPWKNR